MNDPHWQPSSQEIKAAQITAFARRASDDSGRNLTRYAELHLWSVECRADSWQQVWRDCGVVGEMGGPALLEGDGLLGDRWFPEARLNFAENLLRRRDEGTALVSLDESGNRETLRFDELADRVARTAAALQAAGVVQGDRVAGYLPNTTEAVVAMLASATLGAIWSSCSPDFAPEGVIDRFGQIEPKVLFSTAGYHYGGRHFDSRPRLSAILRGLPSVERCVVSPHGLQGEDSDWLPRDVECAVSFDDFLSEAPPTTPDFVALPFDHPLYILYSSGTTGKPKCIVHSAGGTLLQHLKEHQLHADLRPDERLFYFTTCGWMMWNWLVSGLASGVTLVLYDGSPFHPTSSALFDLAERERVNLLGLSAKFIDAVAKEGLEPARTHDLDSVRAVFSTGSPLRPEAFDYVRDKLRPGAQLVSMSGGTDIISCFVLGNPTLPVWRGEIQCAGLGMDVAVVDERGRRVHEAEGELVCTRAFPSMPVGFWNDADQARYRAAYFERFPGVWCHGDWTRETSHGGYVISGRSDAVLNPGGVRIGTAEIYRPVEALDEVKEALAVGQDWEGDVRVVLFVSLREGVTLDDTVTQRIRAAIREGASPRHVPARVLQVSDLPRTRSGKITELAVRDLIHGREIKNAGALANPEVLDQFRDRPELAR
jgi:acetoacetyl-CoA synthetase